jgi:hypothetical protein
MGGLGPSFLHLDGGRYASGPQARRRAVFRAGLGGVLVFLGGVVAAARDGPYTEGYLELDRRPTQRYHLRSPQWRRLYHIIFAGVEGEGIKDIKKNLLFPNKRVPIYCL